MRTMLLLTWAALLGLAGCAGHQGPEATCFSLLEDAGGCDFHALPAAEIPGGNA